MNQMPNQPRTFPQPSDVPPNVHLPAPTIWPFTMAGGVALIFCGFVLSPYFAIAGAVIFAIALRGWILELLHGS